MMKLMLKGRQPMQVAVIFVSCSCKISNFVLFLLVKAKAEQVKTEGMVFGQSQEWELIH